MPVARKTRRPHGPKRSASAVPSAAIQWDREGSFVWAVADGKAKRTAVSIDGRRSGTVLVAGDLQPGDPVVVEGVQKLPVRVKCALLAWTTLQDALKSWEEQHANQ